MDNFITAKECRQSFEESENGALQTYLKKLNSSIKDVHLNSTSLKIDGIPSAIEDKVIKFVQSKGFAIVRNMTCDIRNEKYPDGTFTISW